MGHPVCSALFTAALPRRLLRRGGHVRRDVQPAQEQELSRAEEQQAAQRGRRRVDHDGGAAEGLGRLCHDDDR